MDQKEDCLNHDLGIKIQCSWLVQISISIFSTFRWTQQSLSKPDVNNDWQIILFPSNGTLQNHHDRKIAPRKIVSRKIAPNKFPPWLGLGLGLVQEAIDQGTIFLVPKIIRYWLYFVAKIVKTVTLNLA